MRLNRSASLSLSLPFSLCSSFSGLLKHAKFLCTPKLSYVWLFLLSGSLSFTFLSPVICFLEETNLRKLSLLFCFFVLFFFQLYRPYHKLGFYIHLSICLFNLYLLHQMISTTMSEMSNFLTICFQCLPQCWAHSICSIFVDLM